MTLQAKIAKDLASQKEWRWDPGMKGIYPGKKGWARCIEAIGNDKPPAWHLFQPEWACEDLIPDLEDPATIGSLFARLVEEIKKKRSQNEGWEAFWYAQKKVWFGIAEGQGVATAKALLKMWENK